MTVIKLADLPFERRRCMGFDTWFIRNDHVVMDDMYTMLHRKCYESGKTLLFPLLDARIYWKIIKNVWQSKYYVRTCYINLPPEMYEKEIRE